MTVDADLTTEILRNLREELKSTRAELKADLAELRAEVKTELADLRTDVGVIAMRLEGVERVLVTTVQELIPLVKGLARRVDRLEGRDPTPA